MTLLNLRHLLPSVREHREVEKKVLLLLEETLEQGYLKPTRLPVNPLRYAQRNVFSILFLAIYQAIGIPAERRLLYGVINHAIRGIVTGTDNLLDDEYKEMLPLKFPEQATRFKSVMHILLFDRFLFRVMDEAVLQGMLDAEQRQLVQQKIFQAMVPIGGEEATEEGGVHDILSPEAILESVHVHKGGNLLRLAFVAPRMIEKDCFSALEEADQGIFRIGMALQVIDDLTDFYQDIVDRRHNYLVSSVRFEGTAVERQRLEELLTGAEGTQPVEGAFRESVERVMHRAVGEALAGFAQLEKAGFWLGNRDALRLIRYLFRLRGVGKLLSLWPADNCFVMTLEAGDDP
ncbi:hypothetical protein [Geothermobacter hydrogeniphilus]|uniref:Geranylgeranyl pyrophosphate synthase n=1 Tax=Geothermobacter hydrogeniphilus TaxID=1969733 RepID=A0A1X0Y421_9BACT|nr:hypothetical protein [Geothermobacter hydrogeniphilus]ORJ59804.1 hypothetical protein B5V00_09010 [Geothermobacter hydrogeniphilus]